MNTEQTGLSIEQTIGILRHRGVWILSCVVLVAALAYGLSKHQTKKYTATAAVVFNSNPLSHQIAGLSASNSLPAQQASNLELVKLGDMAARTANLLGHGLTEEKVIGGLSIVGQGETGVVDVSANSTSPMLAAAIANTYVRQFVEEQKGANGQYFKSALALVSRQLKELTPAQRFGADGLDLETRAHTLSLLAGLGFESVQVAQEALVPSSPSSPAVRRNTILGAILGLLLGLGVASLLERLDRRIREPKDLETIYRLPILGVVPKSAALSRSARHDDRGKLAAPPPAEADAFGLIRAHLLFFNDERELRTVLVASPVQGDGKTTVARYLAETAARLGSRVLLLEADLRHPTFAHQFDIQSETGLADVLIGSVSINEAIQSVDFLQAPSIERTSGRTLDVLAAGATLPPNPEELLGSYAMGAVLEHAKSAYDLVVIDTPPLTAVSDAFPLLTKVDGIVIVGRIDHSRRDAAEQLQQVLASSAAPLLGVIANGSRSGGHSSYPRDRKSSHAVAPSETAPSSEVIVPTAKA
jgi:succinoglycan biosynthesis transport protein ExoP